MIRRPGAPGARYALLAGLLLTGLLLGIRASPTLGHATPPTVADDASRLRQALSAAAAETVPEDELHRPMRLHSPAMMRGALEQLYARRGYGPLWTHAQGATPQAVTTLALLQGAADFGLQPEDYHALALSQLLRTLQLSADSRHARLGSEPWAVFDVALSGALLSFVADLHEGRIDPRAAGFELPARPDHFDAALAVRRLAEGDNVATLLHQLEPPFIHYRLLEEALVRYRRLTSQPSLTMLPALPGRIVGTGDYYAGAPALRRLLIALGCLPTAAMSAETRLDAPLVQALRQFQWLYGLRVDGQLGVLTYAALTVPLTSRSRQIELTLERWRWLPPLDERTIIVNIPEFRLFALDSAQDHEAGMLRMNVIVGAEYRRTPVFTAELRSVIFRPYWDVPRSITIREVLPKLAADSGYLRAQHFELVRGQTDASPVVPPTADNLRLLAQGELRLRQRPGSGNALGLVKFLFPNAHDVYLHDTPEGQLFSQARRTFSHGCVRVSNPVALAVYALQGTPGAWSTARVGAAMQADTTQRVALTAPVHVLILYGTAVASEDGAVHFFDDVYGHDRTLAALLDLPSL